MDAVSRTSAGGYLIVFGLRLVGDFQTFFYTFDPLQEAIVTGVLFGIGTGKVAKMLNNRGLTVLQSSQPTLDLADIAFHIRLIGADHAQVFQHKVVVSHLHTSPGSE